MKKIVLIALLLTFGGFVGKAQNSFINEYEVNIGYSIFQGDYGVGGDFSSTLGNYGFLVGGKVYFNFLDSDRTLCYPCVHLKFPVSIYAGYSLLNFNNVDFKTLTPEVIKLKAFKGDIIEASLNAGVEYHIGDLRNFSFPQNSVLSKLDPYVGGSFGVTAYSVNLESDLGDFKSNPHLLPEAYVNRIYDEPGLVANISFEAGFRYKISENLNITISNKWIYYISDKVDGVVPDPGLVKNEHDDWQFSPSLGIVFWLQSGKFFAVK